HGEYCATIRADEGTNSLEDSFLALGSILDASTGRPVAHIPAADIAVSRWTVATLERLVERANTARASDNLEELGRLIARAQTWKKYPVLHDDEKARNTSLDSIAQLADLVSLWVRPVEIPDAQGQSINLMFEGRSLKNFMAPTMALVRPMRTPDREGLGV